MDETAVHPKISYQLAPLNPNMKAKIMNTLGQLASIQYLFHILWFSFSDDERDYRSGFTTPRLTFGLFEEALVKLHLLPIPYRRILDHPDDCMYVAQLHMVDEPTMEVCGEEGSVKVFVYAAVNDDVTLQCYDLTELTVLLERCYSEVSQIREIVELEARDMTRFLTGNVPELHQPFVRPQSFDRNRLERFMIHIHPFLCVTHLRIRIECLNQHWQRQLRVSITPSSGEVARNWDEGNWPPVNLEQAAAERDLAKQPGVFQPNNCLSTLLFNVLDAGNREFVPAVMTTAAMKEVSVIVLSEVNVPYEYMDNICGRLGFKRRQGNEYNPRFGGLWILWDDKCVKLQILRKTEEAIEFVAVEKGVEEGAGEDGADVSYP